MFQNINDILEGWGNNLKDKLNLLEPELKSKGKKRLLICNSCELRVNNTCDKNKKGFAEIDFIYNNQKREKNKLYNGCGCNLSAKTVCNDCKCPLGKWENII